MKRCPRCFESQVQADWSFCPRCGAELEAVPEIRSPTQIDPTAATELLESLQAILERADYTAEACQPDQRVCAALPAALIRRARAAVMRAQRI